MKENAENVENVEVKKDINQINQSLKIATFAKLNTKRGMRANIKNQKCADERKC